MSRKPLRLTALFLTGIIAACVLWIAGPLNRALAGPELGEASTAAFARSVTGTWFMTFGPVRALSHIHADGTFTASDTSDFGGLTGNTESPSDGIWKQTGKRVMLARFLAFAYDSNGVHLITARVTGTITFDASFQTWSTADSIAEIFAPDQDPTDPNETPFDTQPLQLVTASRLNLPS